MKARAMMRLDVHQQWTIYCEREYDIAYE